MFMKYFIKMKKQNCCSLLIISTVLLINLAAVATVCPKECECTKLKKNNELKCKIDSKMNPIDFSNFDTSSITSLDLSGNQISLISNDIFINMINLKKLDLSHNSLNIINEETFNEYLESVEYLKLNQNNIAHVFQGSFSKLKSLKQVDLTSNPLACDCDLMWIQNISIKLKPVPKCGTPEIFKNTNVKRLRIGQDLHCKHDLDPILELKPQANQLIFEGDSLTLKCRAYNLRMKDENMMNVLFWGYSETFPEADSVQDIVYHNPQLKFPSVLVNSRFSDGISDSTLRIPFVTRNHSGNYDCRQSDLSKSVSVLVISDKTKYCPATESFGNKGQYSWPRTVVQKTVILPCFYDSEKSQNVFATRKCDEMGSWEAPKLDSCPFIKESTRILEQFSSINFTRSSVIENARQLKNYTNLERIEDRKKFNDPMDVVFIGKTIQNYLEFIKEEKMLGAIILDIVSQILDLPKIVLEKAQLMDNTCKKLIEAAEKAASMTLSPDSQKNNMAIEIFKLTSESFIEISCSWYVDHSKSRTFECNSAGKAQILHEKNVESYIQFPATNVITKSETTRLLISVFKNDNFFSHNRTFTNYRITSNIIGVKLLAPDGTTINVKNLSDPIFLALKFSQYHHELSAPKPVFLDPDSDSWTLDGCRFSHFVRGLIVFSCNRIGYYGIVQHIQFLNDFPEDVDAGAKFKSTPIGFIIGCSVCFVSLVIIVVTYTVFFEEILFARRMKIAFINTFSCIAILTFLFCIGIFQTENLYICIGFGLSIHYFSLCIIFWICISVSNMYKKISRNDRISMESDLPREEHQREKKPILSMYLIGYGITSLICGINMAINPKDYCTYHFCFLKNISALIFPGSILLFFLVIMFICIRFHLRTRSQEGIENGDIDLLEINNDPGVARSIRSITTNNIDYNIEKEQLFAFILVLVMFILCWSIAAIGVWNPKYIPIYEIEISSIAFAFAASFLGGYIIFFWGFAREDVRNIWMNLIIPKHEEICNKPTENNFVTGSVFYHQPTIMSRSSSIMSRHRKSAEIQYMKSASEINSNIENVNMRNGSSFLLLHRQQNSVINSGASSTAEVFYNQNQINCARRFFKKQKRLQKLNNIDAFRTSPTSSNQLSGTGIKVNNTNIHVDNTDCKTKYSNPNILSDSCNESSELLMDLRFSTLKSKINNTDALQFANIYTNVSETNQPLHEIVTMRVDEKFNHEVFNNLNSPEEKNAKSPLYVNTFERETVEEIYTTKEEISIEELRINTPINSDAMNIVGLPTPPIENSSCLQLKPEEEYISAPLEISNRSFNEIIDKAKEEIESQKYELKSKSKSMDNLDMNKSDGPKEMHIRSISYNNLTTTDLLIPVTKNPGLTSSLMMDHQSQSPLLVSPSLCDLEDFDQNLINNDTESNYTVSNNTINDSQDDLLHSNSKSECTPIYNTPNFLIFNASNSMYDSAPSPTNFSYQNSELSIDLYATQEMAENLNFDISDEDTNDDTFNDSRDFLIPQTNDEEKSEKNNENDNLLKDVDEIYEQITRKSVRPPIGPKPTNLKNSRHKHVLKNEDIDGKP